MIAKEGEQLTPKIFQKIISKLAEPKETKNRANRSKELDCVILTCQP